RQSVLLKRFAEIARKRGRAGDLGEVEVELAQLAYAEGKMAAARVQADVADAGFTLYRITGSADTKGAALPRVPAMTLPVAGSPQELGGRHPAVRAARARAQTASAAVRQADLDRRADPTFGIKGGREDDENLIGLRLSIPLQFLNDFRADVDAARSESVQATEDGAQVERTTQAQLQAEQLRFEKLAAAWRVWENEGRGRLDARLKLLERLWRAGELATTDYLVQVQQTLDTESAGLALRRDLWGAWIAWLRAAGQVQAWLGLERQGESQ
ncbi:MAG: TolC family protein, partial [Gammaproteobacteria bacterium]|nr:TolC family protein [Gammaproteobacteria bacterium]